MPIKERNPVHGITFQNYRHARSAYMRTKKGVPSLPTEVRRINIRHFAEMIERLAGYLDRLETDITVVEDFNLDKAVADGTIRLSSSGDIAFEGH
jgi:hypothetical protein